MNYDLFNRGPKGPAKGTQAERILTWLWSGRSLTPLEALDNFGCMRLAAVVFELKTLGWCIDTDMVNNPKTKKRYARYTMGSIGGKG